jgi:sialate O-acetylesterase
VPAGVLKEGRNVIAIRIINRSGNGGFVKDKPYELRIDSRTVDLKGSWKYRLGARMQPAPGSTTVRWKPLGLFNAMIAPLTNYSIKGVLWYQGETNAERPHDYASLMKALIADWRKQWNRESLPFLLVQLPNFTEARSTPTESNWAQLRQAQLQTLQVPHTGMAVTIDVGEWNDLHPLNKLDVGRRLALQARAVAYKDKVVASGPLYRSVKKKRNKLVIRFSDIGGGLVSKDGGELKHFAIAGSDRKFVWANAQIKGNKVIVWSDAVPDPVVVRYAWADNPESANLYNKAGLPASPFEAVTKN